MLKSHDLGSEKISFWHFPSDKAFSFVTSSMTCMEWATDKTSKPQASKDDGKEDIGITSFDVGTFECSCNSYPFFSLCCVEPRYRWYIERSRRIQQWNCHIRGNRHWSLSSHRWVLTRSHNPSSPACSSPIPCFGVLPYNTAPTDQTSTTDPFFCLSVGWRFVLVTQNCSKQKPNKQKQVNSLVPKARKWTILRIDFKPSKL